MNSLIKRGGAVIALAACVIAAPALAQDRAALLAKLPAELQALYSDAIDIGPSSYDNFTPKSKPWVWCHSESYMGNPWRVTMNDELKRLAQIAIDAGDLVEFVVSDSNATGRQYCGQSRPAPSGHRPWRMKPNRLLASH